MKHICAYGCKKEGKFYFKTVDKWCCNEHYSKCPFSKKTFRTDFNIIKKIVEERKYELLTIKDEYENETLIKLNFKCPEGHIYKTRWDIFLSGCECRKCSDKKRGEKKRTPFEQIVKKVENHGFKLLTTYDDFVNNFSGKFKFVCSENHEFDMRLDTFNKVHKCPKCSNRMKITFKEIKLVAKEAGYKVIIDRKTYKNTFSKLKFICPKNHEFEMRFTNFYHSGQRCSICARQIMSYPNPMYNPEACKLIDKYGKENGYNFQHAENGGEFLIRELRYWVDGYDKEKNVVIEVDEYHHFGKNGNLSERDINRQKEIEEFLKCEFIRLKI